MPPMKIGAMSLMPEPRLPIAFRLMSLTPMAEEIDQEPGELARGCIGRIEMRRTLAHDQCRYGWPR